MQNKELSPNPSILSS